ncbi:MAG: TolC family protein [Dechloromonas sp.]|nr:TolC family protein [Dechloromonas sp.]
MNAATALLLVLACPLAWATPPASELPDAAIVRQVLTQQPGVRAAEYRQTVAQAERARLQAGAHEWTLRLAGQQRRTQPTNGLNERFNEWNTAIERPFRLPGKAAIDRALGETAEQLAETAHGDALHEASRALLQDWFNWLRENAREQQWTAQVALLDQQHQALARRQQLGDAAAIDRIQAAAALGQARAELAQVRGQRIAAGEILQQRYPGLPLDPPPLSTPQAPDGDLGQWISAIRQHSHELGLARQLAQRARLNAGRQQQDRLPDPTIGLQYAHERAGEEQVIGAYLSFPLPGTGRRAIASGAVAEAAAASQDEAAVQQKISSEAATLYRHATAAVDAWQAAKTAAEQMQQAAAMSARAWQLGEGSLSESLLARRLAHDAQLAALNRQLDALALQHRLRLDAHQLWPLDPHQPADQPGTAE